MTVPADRYDDYLIRSVYKYLYDNFASPESLDVNFQNSEFTSDGKTKWVEAQVLSLGAGKKGSLLYQIDIYTRVVGETGSGDIYGSECARLGRVLYAAMHVSTIPIYEFSTPASPTDTNKKLMIINNDGHFREPDESRRWPIENGLNRYTYTYRLMHVEDAAHGHYYD